MATKRTHTKPSAQTPNDEAAMVAKQMYNSLMLKTAPRTTPSGYVLGACYVLKMLIDQASEQGADKEKLKQFVIQFTNDM